jgi:hypothetical protein
MAHFKLKSVDITEMFGGESGTYEYICGKKDKEKSYTRFSGPMGGFDVFNLRCTTRSDYKRANWIVEKLNKKYKDKDYTSLSELAKEVTNLFGNYNKVQSLKKGIEELNPKF